MNAGLFFRWASGPIWLEIVKGLLLGVFTFFWNIYLDEDLTESSIKLFILFQLIFIVGVILLFSISIDLTINHGISLIIALITNLTINLLIHFDLKTEIEKSVNSWWQKGPLRKYKREKGYVISFKWKYIKNGFSSRFGVSVIGVKSGLNTLFGDSGWSPSQEKALYHHELGHTLFAIPIIFIETIIFYWFFTNLSISFISLLLFPMLVAASTLVGWFDELLADTIGGHKMFTLREALFAPHSSIEYILGGTGGYSHPPLLLRYCAFLYALPIAGICYLILYFFKIFPIYL